MKERDPSIASELRKRLRKRARCYGAWLSIGHPEVAGIFATVGDREGNLKRYHGSRMAQRGLPAVLLHSEQGFRRAKGYTAIKTVMAAIEAEQVEGRKLSSAT